MTKKQDDEFEEFLERLKKEDEENEDEESIHFKISTTETNKIVEIEKWTKGQHQLHIKITYESGYVIVDLESYLDKSYSEEEGVDVNNSDFWIDEENLEHPTNLYEFITDIPKSEQQNIIKLYENDSDKGLKEIGWEQVRREIWFKGKLEIVEVEW